MFQTHSNTTNRASLIFVVVAMTFFAPFFTTSQVFGETQTKITLPAGPLAVVPFVKGDFTEEFRQGKTSPLICPIDQICIDLSEGDETIPFMEKLDKHLHRKLKKKLGNNLYSMQETKNQYESLPVDASKDTNLSMALSLAENMKLEYVLVPILWEHSERVGNQFSAEKPASVSFGLYLVSAQHQKRVWKSTFSKTQKSLTENLLEVKENIKFGGKWVTAEDLAQEGMEKLLQYFSFATEKN